MACDIASLSSIDPGDPEQAARLLDECTRALTDPRLWIWAIVLTVACGAIGWLIGRRRGTGGRDALLGAALGPIGWAISFLVGAPKAKPRCPACRREVDAGDAHCRHCGAALPRR